MIMLNEEKKALIGFWEPRGYRWIGQEYFRFARQLGLTRAFYKTTKQACKIIGPECLSYWED